MASGSCSRLPPRRVSDSGFTCSSTGPRCSSNHLPTARIGSGPDDRSETDGDILWVMLKASPERLAHDLAVLAGDIGIRLAGTPGERAAADYVIACAREFGADVWEETFPVNARVVSQEQLELRVGGLWH